MAFNSVPANGWPQIKELEKLDAIASQIENMPTFTSNDKAFLEDLPAYPDTDGTKMLTATTTSGETSLSYEDIPEELPADPQSDGTRVLTATTSSGTTVKSWEAYQSNPDYSTTEQKTGQKWFDGNDIYFKVYHVPTLPNNTTLVIEENFAPTKKVIDIKGVCTAVSNDKTYQYAMAYYGAYATDACYIGVNENDLVVIAKGNWSTYNGDIIIYYTKTA